jgi:hypothetical protein
MSETDAVLDLHDRHTRGEPLSDDEQARLAAWYAAEDAAEALLLGGLASPAQDDHLRARVDASVAQLVTMSQQIQTLVAQNEALRHEIAVLQELVRRRVAPAAA